MKIYIHNARTDERRVQELKGSSFTIGRDDANIQHDVNLGSMFVSRNHAHLTYDGSGWLIESTGLNLTQVNDFELERLRPYRLNLSDMIRIGEYTLCFTDAVKAKDESEDSRYTTRLNELELLIHNTLLERLDLRNIEGVTFQAEQHRDRIEQNLETITEEIVAMVPEDLAEYALKMAFRQEILNMITAEGSPIPSIELEVDLLKYGSRHYEERIKVFARQIAIELKLELTRHSMDADCNRVDSSLAGAIRKLRLDIAVALRKYLVKRYLKSNIRSIIFGLGPLQDLIRLPNISEIMVVSKDQIFVEKNGIIEDSGRGFISDDHVMAVIERIVMPLGRRIDKSSPLVDARLQDGSRVNAIIPPLALKGPCLTIRKFSKVPLTIEDLVRYGTLDERMVNFLRACVIGKKNIIVSGGTGSGKTTLLNVLSAFIPPKERIVTIEDAAELQLAQKHVVSLESRPPNVEGKGAVTIRDLVRNALRMRPDRIVVGECRGAEALDMLQAMNTGHDGSMTTGHANSPEDMVRRLETMVLMGTDMPVSAIREQVVSAIDIVVQLSRLSDGKRRITAISEVCGIDDVTGRVVLEDVFRYKQMEAAQREAATPGAQPPSSTDTGRFIQTGYIPTFIEEFLRKEVVTLDTFF